MVETCELPGFLKRLLENYLQNIKTICVFTPIIHNINPSYVVDRGHHGQSVALQAHTQQAVMHHNIKTTSWSTYMQQRITSPLNNAACVLRLTKLMDVFQSNWYRSANRKVSFWTTLCKGGWGANQPVLRGSQLELRPWWPLDWKNILGSQTH